MAVTDKFNEEWNGFKGRLWKEEVNTRQFIQAVLIQFMFSGRPA